MWYCKACDSYFKDKVKQCSLCADKIYRVIYSRREKYIPDNAVYVGRGSEWGNPYNIGEWAGNIRSTREMVIGAFKLYFDAKMKQGIITEEDLFKLRGKPLVCWCYPQDCHARILIEKMDEIIVNKENKEAGDAIRK